MIVGEYASGQRQRQAGRKAPVSSAHRCPDTIV
jgi:hypothetical protein